MSVNKKTCLMILLTVGGRFLKAPESPFGVSKFESPFQSSAVKVETPTAPVGFESPFENTAEKIETPQVAKKPFVEKTESSSFSAVSLDLPSKKINDENSRSILSGSYNDSTTNNKEKIIPQESMQENLQETMIDNTVDTFETEDSGNWLLKRVWWEKTEDVYEQIKQIFNDIMNSRMEFVTQRNSLDREMDIFYGQIGLEEGPLENIINQALVFIKKDKTQQGFLNKKEQDFSLLIAGKDREFEQLKLDVEALKDLDQKVDEALDMLFSQIDVANKYDQKAWDNFKNIARELNDKTARKTYYETEALLKDIKNIQSYISDEFSAYFTQTVQAAQTHSKSIHAQMNILKQSGIDLKKQLDELEQARVETEKNMHQKPEIKKEVKKNKSEPKGFFSSSMQSIFSFFSSIVSSVNNFFSYFGSSIMHLFAKEEAISVIKKKSKMNEKGDLVKKEDDKHQESKA